MGVIAVVVAVSMLPLSVYMTTAGFSPGDILRQIEFAVTLLVAIGVWMALNARRAPTQDEAISPSSTNRAT